MKRYVVFGGKIYYACGGWRDLLGTYDALEEALTATASPDLWRASIRYDEDELWRYPAEDLWWHIVDTTSQTIVADNDHGGFCY
jgi:hypothetical protein